MSASQVLVAGIDSWTGTETPSTIIVLGPDAPDNAVDVARKSLPSLLTSEVTLVQIHLGPGRQPITVVSGTEFRDLTEVAQWIEAPNEADLAARHHADDGKWRVWMDGRALGISDEDPSSEWTFQASRNSSRLRRMLGKHKRSRIRAQWRKQAQPR